MKDFGWLVGTKPKPLEGGGWKLKWRLGDKDVEEYFVSPWIVVG
jgi:hypothetical protein